MIPSLPVELLSHILDLATSPSYAVSARKDDQHLLRQCCLVSRQFCDVAQPRLWRVFTVTSLSTLAPLSWFPRQAKHIRVIEYEAAYRMASPVNALGKLPNLYDLKVRIRKGSLAKIDLAPFNFLVHLTLYRVEVASTSPVVFPNLVSLTLNRVQMSPEARDTLLLAASFPALRALHTQGCSESSDYTFLEPINLPPGQLDLLQVDHLDLDVFPPDLHSRGTVIALYVDLCNMDWLKSTRVDFADFEHLLLLPTQFTDYYTAGDSLAFEWLLNARKTTLSLSLPETLSPSSYLPSGIAGIRDRILKLCTTRNINIVWRPYSSSLEDEIGWSRDFWEYAKELKRRKATEGSTTEASESR